MVALATARWRPAMLLVLAVALLTAAGSRADARSVTVTGTKCIYDFVPYEGDSVSGNFVLAHHDTFRSSDHPGIDLTVTSPVGNTVYALKGKSGEKFEFRAPSGGMYKFCFHNPYGASDTVSFYIHVGSIHNEQNQTKDGHSFVVEETLEEEPMQKRFEEWMTRYHCTFKEEDMKNRFEKWMAKYNRTYKDEVEKAWRYQLFKECAKRVDRLNALPDGVTYKTNHFCDLSDEEMSLYTGGELV